MAAKPEQKQIGIKTTLLKIDREQTGLQEQLTSSSRTSSARHRASQLQERDQNNADTLHNIMAQSGQQRHHLDNEERSSPHLDGHGGTYRGSNAGTSKETLRQGVADNDNAGGHFTLDPNATKN